VAEPIELKKEVENPIKEAKPASEPYAQTKGKKKGKKNDDTPAIQAKDEPKAAP
jgi:hypothetical protein